MNEIILTENDEIKLLHMDCPTTNISFYHVDRIASMNVMIYVLSGSIYVTEDDKDYVVGEGEMLFLKEGTHQYGKRLIEAGTSWIYAHFQLDKAHEEADRNNRITLPKHINLIGRSDIRQRLEKLCFIYGTDEIMSRKRASLGLFELLLDIEELAHESKTNGLVTDIELFINGNLCRNLSDEDFEKEFQFTYKYLNKVYKKYSGHSIMQTHFCERMKVAATELRTTNKSVKAIGEEMGYADALYFSKVFKKYAGVSPRKYRQMVIRKF